MFPIRTVGNHGIFLISMTNGTGQSTLKLHLVTSVYRKNWMIVALIKAEERGKINKHSNQHKDCLKIIQTLILLSIFAVNFPALNFKLGKV